MEKTFDNIDRTRYYGLRVGDIVLLDFYYDESKPKAKVIGYEFLDNNRVQVEILGTQEKLSWVAEWCQIVTKIEDANTNRNT